MFVRDTELESLLGMNLVKLDVTHIFRLKPKFGYFVVLKRASADSLHRLVRPVYAASVDSARAHTHS
jgi:hypothetical protein